MEVPSPKYKRFLPRSLYGRALMILIVPVAVLQIVVALVFIERHWNGVTRKLATEFAAEISFVADAIEAESDPLEREALMALASDSLGYDIWLEPEGVLAPGIRRPLYGIIPKALTDTLQEKIQRPLLADTVALDDKVDLQLQTEVGILHATPSESPSCC